MGSYQNLTVSFVAHVPPFMKIGVCNFCIVLLTSKQMPIKYKIFGRGKQSGPSYLAKKGCFVESIALGPDSQNFLS